MYCKRQLSHVIKEGDSLYHLAKIYQTTVPDILALNPNVNPYDLKVATSIVICPDENFNAQQGGSKMEIRNAACEKSDLTNRMRLVWEQHIYWTRMLLISIAARLKDQNDVTARLLKNPDDIADIFEDYYTPDITKKMSRLLLEHLKIGGELITALRDGKMGEAENLKNQWYANADEMAAFFAGINPYYKIDDMQGMLYSHLDLTSQEVAMHLSGNYSADIAAFDKVERQALEMADYLSSGLVRQIPQRFYNENKTSPV